MSDQSTTTSGLVSTPTLTGLARATESSTNDVSTAQHVNPVLAFIIGLAIILLASILNAAGLNLTKLDHVRTNATPKSARRKDCLRPLWLLGMILYILSQLIGSTLALDYMRAEYVAPLGSTSLIFNFLFARFLVGTPVTRTDIYGTIIVILGVIGIVVFGGINSGLSSETNVQHLTALWQRGGWLLYFFSMSIALTLVLIFTYSLDAVLAARSDITSEPFTGMSGRRPPTPSTTLLGKAKSMYTAFFLWVNEKLEIWTGPKDDTQIAWILGIGWACCGGGLAGGCLVFAKAIVKLLTGSLSHENPGNQFGHVVPIITIILLATTAVLQIICLNRGLKVYDSTLVVPVFYGVYTATGFLNSLVFNNEVDSYKTWVLFLIFTSIVILISGVVLLTHKKPERSHHGPGSTGQSGSRSTSKAREDTDHEEEEGQALRVQEEGESSSTPEIWNLGEVSDDEEDGVPDSLVKQHTPRGVLSSVQSGVEEREEGSRLIQDEMRDGTEPHHRRSTSSDATLGRNDGSDPEIYHDDEDFGDWK